jgi:hypothetical protein
MANDIPEGNPEFDKADLYLEEAFTDRKVGTIRRLTPVTQDGEVDASREPTFMGQAQVMTQAGPVPLNFEIEAKTLSEAADGFGEAAQRSVEETARRLEEMRRESASSIIVPGEGGASGGAGPVGV